MALVQEPPIDIDVDGLAVRLVVDHPEGAARLREAFRPHLSDQPGEFGFVVEAPADGQRLFRLVDRSGIALARSKDPYHVLASAAGHVASLLAVPEDGAVRLRARAIANGDGKASLLAPPIGMSPPIIERRLDKCGYAILDHTTLVVNPGLQICPTTTLGPFTDPGPAHRSHWDAPLDLSRVLVPAGTALETSPALVASMLAGAMLGSRTDVFAVASAIGERCPLLAVDTMVRGSLYSVLG